MQTTSDPLFELIRSLTRSEKRYFKVICSKHVIQEKNNSLLLFDYLDQLKEYDSEKIKYFISNHINSESIAVIKHRLYEALLNALNQYHLDQTKSGKAVQFIQTIEVLLSKQLSQQAQKRLKAFEQFILNENLIEFKPILIKLSRQVDIGWNKEWMKELTFQSLHDQIVEIIYLNLSNLDQDNPIPSNHINSVFSLFRDISNLQSTSYRLIQSIFFYITNYPHDSSLRKKMELELLRFFQQHPELKKEFPKFFEFFFKKTIIQVNNSTEDVKSLILEELYFLEKDPKMQLQNTEIVVLASTLIYPLHILEDSIVSDLLKTEKNNQFTHLSILKISFSQFYRNQISEAKKSLITSLQMHINCDQIKFLQEFLLLLIHQNKSENSYSKAKLKHLKRITIKAKLPEIYSKLVSYLKTTIHTKTKKETATILHEMKDNWLNQEDSLIRILFSGEQFQKLLTYYDVRNDQKNMLINYKLVG